MLGLRLGNHSGHPKILSKFAPQTRSKECRPSAVPSGVSRGVSVNGFHPAEKPKAIHSVLAVARSARYSHGVEQYCVSQGAGEANKNEQRQSVRPWTSILNFFPTDEGTYNPPMTELELEVTGGILYIYRII